MRFAPPSFRAEPDSAAADLPAPSSDAHVLRWTETVSGRSLKGEHESGANLTDGTRALDRKPRNSAIKPGLVRVISTTSSAKER